MTKKLVGLILGIIGIICAFVGFAVAPLAVAGLPISIVGLVLATVGNKEARNGLGTAAFVVSLIAVIFTAITFFTCGLCVICAAGVGAALT